VFDRKPLFFEKAACLKYEHATQNICLSLRNEKFFSSLGRKPGFLQFPDEQVRFFLNQVHLKKRSGAG